MLNLTEKIIIHQIKRGDEQAFSQFYNTHQPNIYRFIYFKVSNNEKAQDLTNETFLKVYKYLKDDDIEITNFRALLFKIARNLVIDFYRTRREEISLENFPEIASSVELEEEIDQKIKIENIKKYLSSVKPEYQETIQLHFFEGLSFFEISEIIGESEGNVRIRAHRGIKQLKKALK